MIVQGFPIFLEISPNTIRNSNATSYQLFSSAEWYGPPTHGTAGTVPGTAGAGRGQSDSAPQVQFHSSLLANLELCIVELRADWSRRPLSWRAISNISMSISVSSNCSNSSTSISIITSTSTSQHQHQQQQQQQQQKRYNRNNTNTTTTATTQQQRCNSNFNSNSSSNRWHAIHETGHAAMRRLETIAICETCGTCGTWPCAK